MEFGRILLNEAPLAGQGGCLFRRLTQILHGFPGEQPFKIRLDLRKL
jgi:hypothetical protein